MRTVKLYGELGKRFGRVHRFDVASPAEAIRALSANHPSFQKFMIESESHGLGFRVRNGAAEIEDADQVRDPASGDIKIIPVVLGSSAGVRIIIGAVLIAASFLIPGVGPAVAGALLSAGSALALGGVIQLLSPPPKVNEPKERPENDPSYLFNGPVNTTAQGQPVPVAYGRVLVGGAIISAGISIEQIKSGTKIIFTEVTRTLYASGSGFDRVEYFMATVGSTGVTWYSNTTLTNIVLDYPRDYLKYTLTRVTPGDPALPYYEVVFTYSVRSEVPA